MRSAADFRIAMPGENGMKRWRAYDRPLIGYGEV